MNDSRHNAEEAGSPDGAAAAARPSGRKRRCYFILSTKSSGSSVLQRHLSELTSARLPETHHSEHETLFFTKSASILGLPQVRLVNSAAPYSRREARRGLLQFLSDNLGSWTHPLRTEQDFFDAWSAVVRAGPGDIVEKSPHHLYQESVVGLMERYADSGPGIDVHFIGLVRNPLATLCSSWRRFGMRPAREERQWINAYARLLRLAARRPQQVTIVRYEDLITDPHRLADLLGIEAPQRTAEPLHDRSVERWRDDERFRHHLSNQAIQLAERFGYRREELLNERPAGWTARDQARALAWDVAFLLPGPVRVRVQSQFGRLRKSLRRIIGARSG